MDKEFLIRLESTMRSIKQKLLLDDDIRKMLFYEKIVDLENMKAPSIASCSDHVFLQPIIDTDVTAPFDKLNYITITVPESAISNKAHYVVRVMIMCDKRCWTYDDNRIRPIRLAQAIINAIDGEKFQCASPLSLSKILETVTNKTMYGYSIVFGLADGLGDGNDTK